MPEDYKDLSEDNVRQHVQAVKTDPRSRPEDSCELCREADRLGLWATEAT